MFRPEVAEEPAYFARPAFCRLRTSGGRTLLWHCPRSAWPPRPPIALRDLLRDRLFSLLRLALLALPRALVEIGDDAQTLLAQRGVACLELLPPIGLGPDGATNWFDTGESGGSGRA
jgi:hypothetical protein